MRTRPFSFSYRENAELIQLFAIGTIAIDDVPQPAEVEAATSTTEKLIKELRTTCTTKATEMMMLAAKDPRIAAGKAASGDDLTEAEKGKLLSLVSKCVSMVAALQYLGQYIASEQRQSLIMHGHRRAVLDALDLMLAEMHQVSAICGWHTFPLQNVSQHHRSSLVR